MRPNFVSHWSIIPNIFLHQKILSKITGPRNLGHWLTYILWGQSLCHIDRAPDKMRICVFHSNLNVKNSIIFGNVRIMYAKHFPDTQLCPVSKRICFVYILMECGLLPNFPFFSRRMGLWTSPNDFSILAVQTTEFGSFRPRLFGLGKFWWCTDPRRFGRGSIRFNFNMIG